MAGRDRGTCVSFDSTNIRLSKKVLVNQQPAKSYCFLSLRQFLPHTQAGFERRIHALARDTPTALVLIPSASSRGNSNQPTSQSTSRPSNRQAGHCGGRARLRSTGTRRVIKRCGSCAGRIRGRSTFSSGNVPTSTTSLSRIIVRPNAAALTCRT